MVNNWLDIIQDRVFPPTCLLCNLSSNVFDICEPCAISLEKNSNCCYRCGETFESSISAPKICGKCIYTPPAYDETHAPFIFQSGMRYLIHNLKFHKSYKNSRLLGRLISESLQNATGLPELIIPVPLHPIRYRQRGFNQSLEIARTVSNQLKIPLDYSSCQRRKYTLQQSDLPAKRRKNNLQNAFTIARPIKADHIVILDDVMTTGATANELAATIKKSGVSRVDVWVCARA
jgi:ComF family protein